MGAGASIDRIVKDVEEPLRLTAKMNSSIDIVSLIVTRILSTPDIYDLKNLKREGVCGDYIVVLKDKLMASMAMMPYYTASGEEVLYQTPDRLIQDTETRKRVCKEIAESALTIVAIVVSCLASIQVSTKKREQIVTDNTPKTTLTVPKPTPGMFPPPTVISPILPVLPVPQVPQVQQVYPASVQYPASGLIQPSQYPRTPYNPLPIYPTPGAIQPTYPRYQTPYSQYGYPQMQGGGYDQTALDWLVRNNYIQLKAGATQEYDVVDSTVPKTQSFVLNTENSATIYKNITPGLTADIQFVSIEKSPIFNSLQGRSVILHCLPPITIPSSARESVLPIRLLDATGVAFFTGILYNGMFRSFTESKAELLDFPTILFLMFRISQPDIDSQLKDRAIRIMDSKEQRKQNKLLFERGKYDPNAIVQVYNTVLSGRQPVITPVQPTGYYGMIPGKVATQEYSIPSSAAFSIMQTLDTYKTKLASDSCPAMIRAKSLLDELTEARRVRTKFCSDIYWNLPNLGKIYPYTTFQFLCIKDWSSPHILEPAFNAFCDSFVKTYNDASGVAPKLVSPPRDISGVQAQFGRLDSMRFDSASYETLKKEYCSTGPLIAEPKDVADVLEELNAEFTQHIASVLKVIDSLIIVIKDPDTDSYVARLSPEITSRKRSTKGLILAQKEAAMSLLSRHYIRVEELYLKGVRRIVRG